VYEGYFGLTERPFSIAPDPHYLYMSARHKEATAHLSYGLTQGGCFIVLTGEVGTGKTTLCRNLLSDLPQNVDVALILNANINESELLQTVCDELKVEYADSSSQKQLLDLINQHLLATFADNRHTVLIIDEAQLLSRDVLEQIRLLTNLETTKSKLLQIILIGQPELNDLLSRNDLRQLAQRVTARYHLGALERSEIEDYINFRLGVAGCKQPLFSRQALNKMYALTAGIPRKINVLADHALLSTYSKNQSLVDAKIVKKAAQDVFVDSKPVDRPVNNSKRWWALAALFLSFNIAAWWFFYNGQKEALQNNTTEVVNKSVSPPIPADVQSESDRMGDDSESADSNSRPDTILEPQEELPTGPQLNASTLESEAAEPTSSTDTIGDDSNTQSEGKLLAEPEVTATDQNAVTKPGTVQVSEEYLDASPIAPESVSLNLDADSKFGRVLETSADITGRGVAVRVLAQQWGVELPTPLLKSSCEVIKESGLACVAPRSLVQLLRFNRPAIVALSHQNQLHRVVLVSASDDVVTVLVGSNTHRLSMAEFEQRWTNRATAYWRPNAAGDRFLQYKGEYSDLGKIRLYLNSALSKVNMPLLENVDSTVFDLEMAQKVFALQTRFDILSDSKISYETYMLMNEIISSNNTPVLTNRLP